MRSIDIKLSLMVIISFFWHIVLVFSFILPDISGLMDFERKLRERFASGRDIIVNINQDNKRVITKKTLLSDRDSSAKGYITLKKGDRWLNNSLDFKLLKGSAVSKGTGQESKGSKSEKILLSQNSEVVILLQKELPMQQEKAGGKSGYTDKILIPDKNDVTRQNAIFYSNSGIFSFNTAKFKNFKYFKSMKDKIASNWYPPLLANANLGGYAPGTIRLRAIPSQEVKLFFTMNRDGDVLDIQILDSYRNRQLDSSCIDAIRLSKNFGVVPEDIKGEVVVIPFIFGYYIH